MKFSKTFLVLSSLLGFTMSWYQINVNVTIDTIDGNETKINRKTITSGRLSSFCSLSKSLQFLIESTYEILLLLFLFLAQTEGNKYYLRYADPQPFGIYVGEPINWQEWPTGVLSFTPGAYVIVDKYKQTVRLEELKPKENYRLKTLATTHPDWEYMYMSYQGTKCNPITLP